MMRISWKHCLIAICVAVTFGLIACGDKAPPAPATQVVKKKIGGQNKKAAPVTNTARSEPKSDKGTMVKEAAATEQSENSNTSKLIEASKAAAATYDSRGRFDPFEPLLKDDAEQGVTTSKSRKKRIPQTPLERVAISQLKLSAIMRSSKGNSAIVEDATGKGYVVRKGTYIGLNSGQVTKISKSSVMIEEEIEDVSGEFRIQNIELKLQKPAGEL
ncbi:MAG: pilus assembly protein PilP [Desulfobacteraceae bacterium]